MKASGETRQSAEGHIFEIPFVSATALDGVFAAGKGGAAFKKYRQVIAKDLDPGERISIGRLGTVQVTSVANVACMATAGRWDFDHAQRLGDAYKVEGLLDLVHSADYQTALDLGKREIQNQGRGGELSRAVLPTLIPRCFAALAQREAVVLRVFAAMRAILQAVDAKLDEVKRIPGRLVRIEGPSAVTVVDTGEREELRLVDTQFLEAQGIREAGDAFVAHEMSWSPDSKTTLYFPAVDDRRNAAAEAALDAELRSREQTLPEPPAELREALR